MPSYFSANEYESRMDAFAHATTSGRPKFVHPKARGDSCCVRCLKAPLKCAGRWRVAILLVALIVLSVFYLDEETLATIGTHVQSAHAHARKKTKEVMPKLQRHVCKITGKLCTQKGKQQLRRQPPPRQKPPAR